MSTEVLVTVTPGIVVPGFYLTDKFSHRGSGADSQTQSVDRNNLFIVLFMAAETQSQGIKHAHKRA